MKQVGALFKAPMVHAILREIEKPGTGKTQTRRLLYTPREAKNGIVPASATVLRDYDPPRHDLLPITHYWSLGDWQRRRPGDLLWVRETWATEHRFNAIKPINLPDGAMVHYHADGPKPPGWGTKRVAIHLPEKFSRITCIVKKVRIERLRRISQEDAIAEGWTPDTPMSPIDWYRLLWNSINAHGRWEDDPWVVSITFDPVLENIASVVRRLAA